MHIIVNAVKAHRRGHLFVPPGLSEPGLGTKHRYKPGFRTVTEGQNCEITKCGHVQPSRISLATKLAGCVVEGNLRSTFIRTCTRTCPLLSCPSALPFMPVGCISTSITPVTRKDWPQMRREAQKYVVGVMTLLELLCFCFFSPLTKVCLSSGNVYIHPTANIDPTAVVRKLIHPSAQMIYVHLQN